MEENSTRSSDISVNSLSVEDNNTRKAEKTDLHNDLDLSALEPRKEFKEDIDAVRRMMSTMRPSIKRVLEFSPDQIALATSENSVDSLESKNIGQIEQRARTETTIRTTTTTAKTVTTKGSPTEKPLLEVVSEVWGGVRRMLGLRKPDCKNGGKAVDNSCKCPKNFEGQFCEQRVCFNGGQLTKSTVLPVTYDCKCPDPLYIEGVHCEVIKCSNKAPLVTSQNGTWNCDCSNSYFFTGRYCEKFEAPYTFIGVALLGLVLLILCCGLCRIDWCPKRRNRPRNRQRGSDPSGMRGPDTSGRLPTRNPNRLVSGAQTQDFLLPRNPMMCRTGSGHGPPYVIRLDTIPTFNPDMIGGVQPDGKPMDPPPSYDQALSAPTAPQPPRYSETDDALRPARAPSRQPPDTPR